MLITGASRGIGLATAEAFAREGARLALLARESPALEDALGRVQAHDPGAVAVAADLADREATAAAVREAIEALGGLDVLVSNAAVVTFGPFEAVEPDAFGRVIDVTFEGAVNVIREALPALQESKGTIVATGSLMSRIPLPMLSSYAAAKYALRGFLLTLRAEQRARRTGVQVAIVHPGPVASPLWHQMQSAIGRLPRIPFEGYRTETIAGALVRAARHPRTETIIGGESIGIEGIVRWTPFGDLLMDTIYRFYASGKEPAPPGALWDPPPGLDRSTRLIPRPSLLGAAQAAIDRAGRLVPRRRR